MSANRPAAANPTDYITNAFLRMPDNVVGKVIQTLEDPVNPIPLRARDVCEDIAFRAVRMYGEPGYYDEGEVAYLRGIGCGAVLAAMTISPQELDLVDAPMHTRFTRDEKFALLMLNAGILYVEREDVRGIIDDCVAGLEIPQQFAFLATHGIATGLKMAELGRLQRMQAAAEVSVLRNTKKIVDAVHSMILNEQRQGKQALQQFVDAEYEILVTELEHTAYGPYSDTGLY